VEKRRRSKEREEKKRRRLKEREKKKKAREQSNIKCS
jgi:hypothetical protein